ncbi:hypothetical protein [Flammeovirga sp. SJP92]|uniref:hypothetical protein n=1 Tax=Flammeovirga sp. SJP92 TaxID=1775430 RepID=UPI0007992180|nr:hypothetical protein [Flammeovirga sp. SJP92]KXX69221.1 hypothetical protein AVL50_20200 [Flammeovirga sp. SJP92]
MITGLDYISYSSDRNMLQTIKHFKKILKNKWDSVIYEEDIEKDGKGQVNKITLFIAPNQSVYDSFDDLGYTINSDKESCFMLAGSKKESSQELSFFKDHKDKIDGECNLFLANLIEWTLVLPQYLEKDNFSYCIYDLFINTLGEKSGLETYSILPKPVQYYL